MRPPLRFPLSVAAIVALAGGLTASGVLAAWLAADEHAEEIRFLERAADIRLNAFQNGLNEALEGLSTINQLFVTVNPVSREQFRIFTQPLLKRHPYVHAYAFQRVVSAAEKPAYEAGMRKQYPDFAVTEFWNGRLAPADGRRDYHVVDYIEPVGGNETILGFNASSTPSMRRAIHAATGSGKPTGTEIFQVIHQPGAPRGFVVVMPVYRNGVVPPDEAARREEILGHTTAAFQAGKLIEKTLGRAGLLDTAGLDIRVYGGGPPVEENLAFRSDQSHLTLTQMSRLTRWLFERKDLVVSRPFEVAGVQWHMQISSAPGTVGGSHVASWIVLIAGSMITVLAAAYLQSLTRRTAELGRANALLSEDIAAPQRMEQALRESEDHFQRLAAMSSDWTWEQDADLRLTKISGDSLLNQSTDKLSGKALWELPFEATEVDWAAHQAIVQARQPFTDVEYKVQESSGRVHWIVVNGEPLFDAKGEFIGYRGTAKDLTARKEAELALRQSQQELRELTAHQEWVKEDERKRIAREIHDDLGQNLLALRIDVSMLDAATAGKHPELNAGIRAVLAQIDNTMKSVRAIINNLRPSVLDLGLQAAIEWQVQQFRNRTAIPCSLIIDEEDFDDMLDEESATSVFRIVQESLTNISRHAYASHAEITMRREDNILIITIGDNGVGSFPGNQRKPRSFGLIGIRERIHRMGGELTVESRPGQGTLLTFAIPISEPQAAAA